MDATEHLTITEAHLEQALRYLQDVGLLREAIAMTLEEEGEEVPAAFFATVSTFREAGVLTMNRGVVLYLSSGDEFQLSIVRSGR